MILEAWEICRLREWVLYQSQVKRRVQRDWCAAQRERGKRESHPSPVIISPGLFTGLIKTSFFPDLTTRDDLQERYNYSRSRYKVHSDVYGSLSLYFSFSWSVDPGDFTWVAKSGKEDAWTLSSVRGVLVLWWMARSRVCLDQCCELCSVEQVRERWEMSTGARPCCAVCHFKAHWSFSHPHTRVHKKTHKKPTHLHHPQSVFSIQAAWEQLTWLAFPHPSSSWLCKERLGGCLDWTDMFISGEWCSWMGPAAAQPFVTAEQRPCEPSN